MKFSRYFILLALVAMLQGCSISKDAKAKADNSRVVTGTIYTEQPIIPAGDLRYNTIVSLLDVSKMDVAATVVSSISFTNAAFPVDYTIAFSASAINPQGSYALNVRIADEAGRLVGVTDQHHRYRLSDPNIRFDVLVKAVQLDALNAVQRTMTCGSDSYSLDIYPSLLVKTNLAHHNRHILPRVVSASGEHYERSRESIFMKGDNPPLVETNGVRLSCHIERK